MDFRVQYVMLHGVPRMDGLDDIVRKSFKHDAYKGLDIKLSRIDDFEADDTLAKDEFYDRLANKLWDEGVYRKADMTIVICNETFLYIEEGGDPEHREQIFEKPSISYMGVPGEFSIIPALVNLETLGKTFTPDGWVYENPWVELPKLVAHETGHSMGCDHCEEPGCLMHEQSLGDESRTSFCSNDSKTICASIEKYFGRGTTK